MARDVVTIKVTHANRNNTTVTCEANTDQKIEVIVDGESHNFIHNGREWTQV